MILVWGKKIKAFYFIDTKSLLLLLYSIISIRLTVGLEGGLDNLKGGLLISLIVIVLKNLTTYETQKGQKNN